MPLTGRDLMLARQAELKARSAPQNGNGSEVVFGDDVKPQVAGPSNSTSQPSSPPQSKSHPHPNPKSRSKPKTPYKTPTQLKSEAAQAAAKAEKKARKKANKIAKRQAGKEKMQAMKEERGEKKRRGKKEREVIEEGWQGGWAGGKGMRKGKGKGKARGKDSGGMGFSGDDSDFEMDVKMEGSDDDQDDDEDEDDDDDETDMGIGTSGMTTPMPRSRNGSDDSGSESDDGDDEDDGIEYVGMEMGAGSKGKFCTICKEEGHEAIHCVVCEDCGQVGTHAAACTRRPCTICNSESHTRAKCTLQSPYLFSYEYYTPTERADLIASKKATLMLTGSAHRKGAVGLEVFEGNGGVSCYTCGSWQHWGDDCDTPRRWHPDYPDQRHNRLGSAFSKVVTDSGPFARHYTPFIPPERPHWLKPDQTQEEMDDITGVVKFRKNRDKQRQEQKKAMQAKFGGDEDEDEDFSAFMGGGVPGGMNARPMGMAGPSNAGQAGGKGKQPKKKGKMNQQIKFNPAGGGNRGPGGPSNYGNPASLPPRPPPVGSLYSAAQGSVKRKGGNNQARDPPQPPSHRQGGNGPGDRFYAQGLGGGNVARWDVPPAGQARDDHYAPHYGNGADRQYGRGQGGGQAGGGYGYHDQGAGGGYGNGGGYGQGSRGDYGGYNRNQGGYGYNDRNY